MKTLLGLLLAGVQLIVVEAASSTTNPLPDSLGIGEKFPPANMGFGYVVATNSFGNNGFEACYSRMILYDRNKGGPAENVQSALTQLGQEFKPLPGTENFEYQIWVNIAVELTKDNWQPAGGQDIPAGTRASFKLRKDSEGNFKIPEELLKANLGYQSYQAFQVPGLTSAELVVRQDGREIVREVSQNGVADNTCSLYPGQPNYYGPDVLQLHTRYIVPERREDGIDGELTLHAGAFWKKYNLLSGEVIATSEDPVPPKLSISPVVLKISGLSAKSEPPAKGIRLAITTSPEAVVTIEYSDSIGGAWQSLVTLSSDTTGSAEFVDNVVFGQRFYRARLGE